MTVVSSAFAPGILDDKCRCHLKTNNGQILFIEPFISISVAIYVPCPSLQSRTDPASLSPLSPTSLLLTSHCLRTAALPPLMLPRSSLVLLGEGKRGKRERERGDRETEKVKEKSGR